MVTSMGTIKIEDVVAISLSGAIGAYCAKNSSPFIGAFIGGTASVVDIYARQTFGPIALTGAAIGGKIAGIPGAIIGSLTTKSIEWSVVHGHNYAEYQNLPYVAGVTAIGTITPLYYNQANGINQNIALKALASGIIAGLSAINDCMTILPIKFSTVTAAATGGILAGIPGALLNIAALTISDKMEECYGQYNDIMELAFLGGAIGYAANKGFVSSPALTAAAGTLISTAINIYHNYEPDMGSLLLGGIAGYIVSKNKEFIPSPVPASAIGVFIGAATSSYYHYMTSEDLYCVNNMLGVSQDYNIIDIL